jgi:DNA helicase-2/ATP-dependent DNA helicase PcrA
MLEEIKRDMIESIETSDEKRILDNISKYKTVKFEKIVNLSGMDDNYLKKLLTKAKTNSSNTIFSKDKIIFSPSALLDYDECPKRYELSRLLHMPNRSSYDKNPSSSDIGTFVHKVLEIGVNKKLNSEKDYSKLVDDIAKEEEKDIPIEEIKPLIKIFWERNKNKIKSSKPQTEVKLPLEIEGYKFYGLADRIDEHLDSSLEIIDYKTNKASLTPKKRSFQMGYYALAAKYNFGKFPKYLTLEMLKCEKPEEFEIEGTIAKPIKGRAQGFDLIEVEKEFLRLAKSIERDYETQFKPTDDENSCKFCDYKFYCPKWENR